MTANPPVVVEMSAADAGAPYAQVLVQACSAGLREEGPCALEGGAPADAARAVAVVSWEGDDRATAKVEVGVRHGQRADWLTRTVTFARADAEEERWRSVGLIIATLVGIQTGGDRGAELPAPPPTAPAAVAKEPSAADKVSAPPPPARTWFVEADAVAARGAGDVLGAWGGALRGGVAFAGAPVFVTGSLRYEIAPDAAPDARLEWGWVSLGAGLAAPLGRTPLVFEARCEPTLGGVRATASRGGSAQSGGLFGVREGIGLTWWVGRALGVALGAEALETTRSAVVNVSGGAGYPAEARAQWLGWSTAIGLRFRSD
ncbi:MAG TPA: hypothetical protein VGI39_11595 [Polyangiaceae bacterium]|jgi:hypothetical protein